MATNVINIRQFVDVSTAVASSGTNVTRDLISAVQHLSITLFSLIFHTWIYLIKNLKQ